MALASLPAREQNLWKSKQAPPNLSPRGNSPAGVESADPQKYAEKTDNSEQFMDARGYYRDRCFTDPHWLQ
jgi:hypothetical protein